MEFNAEAIKPAIARLKRARGQLDAVIRMLEDGEDSARVITQLAAVAKAVDKAGLAIILIGLKQCREHSAQDVDVQQLERLFMSFA